MSTTKQKTYPIDRFTAAPRQPYWVFGASGRHGRCVAMQASCVVDWLAQWCHRSLKRWTHARTLRARGPSAGSDGSPVGLRADRQTASPPPAPGCRMCGAWRSVAVGILPPMLRRCHSDNHRSPSLSPTTERIIKCLLCTPCFIKKTTRYLIAHNFGKCWSIFKMFSLSDSAVIV